MRPDLPRYITRSDRGNRQRRARRRRLVLALVVILAAAVVVVLAFTLLGGNKSGGPTSTSAKPAASTSTSTKPAPASSTTSLSAASTTSTETSLGNGTQTYLAQLSGQNESPALSTSASGTLTITVAADGSSAHYVLTVSKITNLTLARLHEGKAGATGTTVLTIYGGPTRSDVFTGVVTQGSFTAAQLGGSLRGETIADFVALVKAGSVYLNVGTSAHPLGEIRGQLE